MSIGCEWSARPFPAFLALWAGPRRAFGRPASAGDAARASRRAGSAPTRPASAPARRRRSDRSARRQSRTRRPWPCPCRAPATRAAAPARGRDVCGRSPRGCRGSRRSPRTVMSSTSRMTNTVRKASGSSSMRRSSIRRTSARSAAFGGDSACRRPRRPPSGRARPVAGRSNGTTTRSRFCLRSRMSAWLMTMRVSHVASWASPRKSPMWR